MLTIGFIVFCIAVATAIYGFGFISSSVAGPARIAFYFFISLAILMLCIGVIQQATFVDPTTPIQRQSSEEDTVDAQTFRPELFEERNQTSMATQTT